MNIKKARDGNKSCHKVGRGLLHCSVISLAQREVHNNVADRGKRDVYLGNLSSTLYHCNKFPIRNIHFIVEDSVNKKVGTFQYES
jgi:hypothetical protein